MPKHPVPMARWYTCPVALHGKRHTAQHRVESVQQSHSRGTTREAEVGCVVGECCEQGSEAFGTVYFGVEYFFVFDS